MASALVAGALAFGWAPAANAATSYGVIATVDLGAAVGDGLAVDPAHNSAYVVHGSTNKVSVIDLATNTVKATIPVGAAPFRVAVDAGLDRAYVTNHNGNSVSEIDTTTNTVVRTIGGFAGPRDVAVDPTTHLLYVANYWGGENLSVVDPTTSPATITNTAYLGSRPWAVAVDPTTHLAYVSTLFGDTVSVVSGTTIVTTLSGFRGPTMISLDPDAGRAYVPNAYGASVIDTTTNTVTGSQLPAGTGPSDVAVDPASHLAYVSNSENTVSVIDQTSGTRIATVPVSGPAYAVGIDPATHRVYALMGNGKVAVIAPLASQEVAFTSAVPTGSVVGDGHTVTATGGASGKPVTFSTSSPACQVTSGGQVTFTHAGTCVVAADQAGDSGHTAAPTVTQQIEVARAPQAITFTSVAPADATVGGSYPVTATGGGSPEPVTFSIDPATTNAACTVTNGAVSFDHAGSCVVAADQGGTGDYTAAPTATQQLAVGLEPTTTEVNLPTSAVVSGQPATATVAVGDTHDGSVQFTVDGTPVGSPVVLSGDGTVTSPDLVGLTVGSHQVGAVFAPADDNRYATSSATPQTLTVSQAATTASVTVDASTLTATVTPTAPGSGVPTGRVRFFVAGTEVGSAALGNGTALLAYRIPTGSSREVSATYAGDASFTGASASTARRDPVITASVSPSKAPRHGWYAGPVTVTFHCQETSAELIEACPAPVTLSRSAAAQSVTRTIVAADGGAATAVVKGINIDRVRPVARVTGVRAGATYFAAGPAARCRAADRLSGIATCTVTRTTHGNRVAYVATATDRAGNRSSSRVVVRTTTVAISGASMKDGRYVVHRGRTYTVLVAAATRPSYVYAAPAPHRPAGGGIPFERIGKNRWALGVTFTPSMSHHALWNIGTRVGGHTTVTTVRVVR